MSSNAEDEGEEEDDETNLTFAGTEEQKKKKKNRKKKIGKKERMKLKAKELIERGMTENEARKEVGLNEIIACVVSRSTKEVKRKKVNPQQLTANIKNTQTIAEMFKIIEESRECMNHIHLSAFWNKLGRYATYGNSNSTSWLEQRTEALDLVIERTKQVINDTNSAGGIRGRELANILHGVAKSGVGVKMNECFVKELSHAIERHLDQCNPQELANSIWAFAKCYYFDSDLFRNLAICAEKHARENRFNPQEITNILWAFATADNKLGDNNNNNRLLLIKALAKAAANSLSQFSMQGLSTTAWALAKLNFLDQTLFKAIAELSQRSIERFNAQDFSNLCFAFASSGQNDAALFTTMAKHAEKHVEQLNAQGLSLVVWSFSKVGHLDARFFEQFGKAIERRMFLKASDFNAQDISNIAFAFGKACHKDDALFTILARTAERILNDFNVQDICNLVWSCSFLGIYDVSLLEAVRRSLLTTRLVEDIDAANIANLLWSFQKAQKLDEELVTAMANAAEKRVLKFSTTDLTNVAWNFANADKVPEKLFAALARAVEQKIHEFGEEDLDNLEYAFTKADQMSIVKQLKNQRKNGSNEYEYDANVDVSKCGKIIVAGGGIGGAALAVSLQKKGFEVIVLESDENFESRAQGYGLTVQATNAMHAMGVDISSDDAPSTSHYTFSSDGNIIGFFGEAFGTRSKDRKEVQNSGRFIHIPRQVLRKRIVEAVRPGTIRWNSKLKSFKENEDGVEVTLMDGSSLKAALLIGSDGIFSTVRRQLNLPGDRLNYVGLCVVLGIVDDNVLKVPLAKRRIFETVDGTTRLYAMPFTTTSTMWQLSFPCSEETARMYTKDAMTLKKEITRRCEKWHQPIPELLKCTPLDCMSGYPVYDRDLLDPLVLRPPNIKRRRVTVIGDAAHPMTPFKAQGANQAISDAVLFADLLLEGVGKLGPIDGFDYALPIFEKKMLARSSRMVVGSREKAKEMHSALALQPARKAQREAEFDLPTVLRVLREKNIGAQSAIDPRNLDSIVADAAVATTTGVNFIPPPTFSQGTKLKFNEDEDIGEKMKEKKKRKKEKKEKREKKEKKRAKCK